MQAEQLKIGRDSQKTAMQITSAGLATKNSVYNCHIKASYINNAVIVCNFRENVHHVKSIKLRSYVNLYVYLLL